MTDLKSLNELLSKAIKNLDSASTEIRNIPLNPIKENIYKIGDALTSILEIQRQIYDVDPNLESEHLKQPSLYTAELNRLYREIVVKVDHLCNSGKYQEAITLYRNFINENPSEFFTDLANDRIAQIKKDYGV